MVILLEGNELVRAVFQYKGDRIKPLQEDTNITSMQIYLQEAEQKHLKRKRLKKIFFPYFWALKMKKKFLG